MASDDFEEAQGTADELGRSLTLSASTFSRILRSGMRSAVRDGFRLDSVLKRAALSISSSALTAALKPLSNLMGSGFSNLFKGFAGSLSGAVGTAATKAVPFAEGGVIGSPTAFGLPGGRVGLMGEAGREAVLPLARGSDGRLGVALEGQGARAANITVNIQTPDAESFRRSEAQVTAALARAVARGRRGL